MKSIAVILAVVLTAGMVGAAFSDTDDATAAAGTAPATAAPGPPPQVCNGGAGTGLNREQESIARVGIDAATRAGTGIDGARIIIAAGLVESELKDLDYGDRDSIGWLQQRPSKGWNRAGDPKGAADDFLTALKAVPGWKQMPPGDAAQRVQRSGHPERYGRRMAQAEQIVAALTKGGCVPQKAAPLGACPPSGLPVESGLRSPAARGLRCGAAAFPKIREFGGRSGRPNKSDHPNGDAVDFMIPGWNTPSGKTLGWSVAHWLETQSGTLNVKYVIFDDKIWRPSGSKAGWRPYTHPNGPTSNPTLRHLDHVHVSFKQE